MCQVTKWHAPSVTKSESGSHTLENSSLEEIQFLGASMVGLGVKGSDMSSTSSAGEELEVDSDSDVTMAAEEELEAWEEESNMLAGICSSITTHVKGWEELRKQIKKELQKHSKSLSLSQINQHMILANFTTLHLKGLSWISASEEIARQWHDGKGSWFACHV
ncbi:hypothetical protein APHAL10511_002517 [Amanita phalloides]|nr:hypothetical protein APHAL10511_002517 [Amanita phalloides]